MGKMRIDRRLDRRLALPEMLPDLSFLIKPGIRTQSSGAEFSTVHRFWGFVPCLDGALCIAIANF